jgi:hypothetical protein
MQHLDETAEIFENICATYMYSHCNIRKHTDKTCATSKWNIWNINLKHIHQHGAWCPRSPVTEAANSAYKCGPVLLSRTPRAGHSLSGHHALFGHAVHAWAPRTVCILCRASDRTRSQALTRKKDRCGPCLTTTAHASFFLGYHAKWVGSTDVLNQALLFFLRRCPCPHKWNLYRWFN